MKKLINFRFSLFLSLSIVCGILCGYFVLKDKTVSVCFTALLFVISCILYLFFYKGEVSTVKKAIFVAVFTAVAIIGFTSFSYISNGYKNANLNGSVLQVEGRVSQVIEEDDYDRIVLTDVKFSGKYDIESKYKLLLYDYAGSGANLGDVVKFETTIHDKDVFYEGRFASSDLSKGVKYYASVYSDEVTVKSGRKTVFESFNLYIKSSLKRGLDGETFPIGYALLTGNSNYIEDEVIGNFRAAGVAHIFAVSGLHIGILATAISFLLEKFKCNKYARIIITLSVCTFYSGVCGFSASSIRATVMCAVLMLSKLKGERYDGLSSLSLAFFLILLFSPVQLFCVGFQLSFGVVLGITLLGKSISSVFKFFPDKISNALGAVLSAQIMSIPICLYSFGNFSLISIIANLLFLPFVGAIYILLFVSALIGSVFAPTVILFPSKIILKAVYFLINSFDYGIFIISGISFGCFTFAYYLSVLFASDLLNVKELIKNSLSVIFAVTFAIGAVCINVNNGKHIDVYVCGERDISVCLFVKGQDGVLVVSKENFLYSTTRIKRMIDKSGIDGLDYVIIMNDSNGLDLQGFTTKIYSVVDVDNVIYYGEKRSNYELIMGKSFPDITCKNVKDGNSVSVNGMAFTFKNGGKFISVIDGEKRIGVFSDVKNEISAYSDIDGEYDLMVAYDCAEQIFSKYNPERCVSYLRSTLYEDGESNGNRLIKI